MSRRFAHYTACGLVLALAGCGATSGSNPDKPRPPTPVNLTVYISNSRVSVSPDTVGAGPVVFIVTNQARSTQSLSISQAGFSTNNALANTGPINPQATATVTVDFKDQGDYTVDTSGGGSTQATQALPSGIQSATVHVGPPRPNGSNQLLQP
jgi:hypothetical protein